jgi:hypothetical protein
LPETFGGGEECGDVFHGCPFGNGLLHILICLGWPGLNPGAGVPASLGRWGCNVGGVRALG